jgi:hypothetical protein
VPLNITTTFNPLRLEEAYSPRIRQGEIKDLKGANDRITALETELLTFARKNSELQRKIVENFNKNQELLNTQKREIQTGVEQGNTTIVNRIGGSSSGGGGGSTTSSDITTVSVSLAAGVASPEVFSAPATLISVPVGYTTIDGMLSAEILPPSSLTVSGFTVTPLQSCVCIYSYKLL